MSDGSPKFSSELLQSSDAPGNGPGSSSKLADATKAATATALTAPSTETTSGNGTGTVNGHSPSPVIANKSGNGAASGSLPVRPARQSEVSATGSQQRLLLGASSPPPTLSVQPAPLPQAVELVPLMGLGGPADGLPNYRPPERTDRAAWGGKLEFIMTMVGSAVGLGNIWRFPYLCYKNGGGAFLIPYTVMVVVLGIPLFLLESSLGQFASLGATAVFKISPLWKGLGYAMVLICWFISLYYNVVIAECLYFLFASFSFPELPWTRCNPDWATPACRDAYADADGYFYSDAAPGASGNTTWNATPTAHVKANFSTPATEYFERHVLQQSHGIEEPGGLNMGLFGCLAIAWLIVAVALIRGVASLGKVVYFTAIFPYVMLTLLLINGLRLEGAWTGILYYIRPNFTMLLSPKVWSEAATQVFYSTGVASGQIITMASFNKFSNNLYRDALLVCLVDSFTSVFAGGVVFSVLGFMAAQKHVDIDKVTEKGPGLAFQVYPEAISRMMFPQIWAIFFFFMMCTLGFGSQFGLVECVMASVEDELRDWNQQHEHYKEKEGGGEEEQAAAEAEESGEASARKERRKKLFSSLIRLGIMFFTFLCGISMITNGGIYVLNLVDASISGFPMLLVGLLECVVFQWVYGFNRLAEDIKLMTGLRPNLYYQVSWRFLAPAFVLVLILVNVVQYESPKYGDKYNYPGWALAVGWVIALLPVCLIFGWAIYYYALKGGCVIIGELMKPSSQWGPACREHHDKFIDNIQTCDTLKQENERNGGLFQSGLNMVQRLSRAVSRDSGLNIVALPLPPGQNLRGSRLLLDQSEGFGGIGMGCAGGSSVRLGSSQTSRMGSFAVIQLQPLAPAASSSASTAPTSSAAVVSVTSVSLHSPVSSATAVGRHTETGEIGEEANAKCSSDERSASRAAVGEGAAVVVDDNVASSQQSDLNNVGIVITATHSSSS